MKKHSESYLKTWTKEELIEHIMCLEHNAIVNEGVMNTHNSFLNYMSDEENINKTCKQVQKEWCDKKQAERKIREV